jgi:hypothetical protein
LLDRLIRGRAWIPLLGVMLAGIVAMQVEVLKLGASIGRSIEQTTALQTRNETLRETISSLDDDERIKGLAAKQGMVMPVAGGVGFLSAGAPTRTVDRAITNIHSPNAAAFLGIASNNGAVASAQSNSTTATAQSANADGTAGSTVGTTPAPTGTASTGSTASTTPAPTGTTSTGSTLGTTPAPTGTASTGSTASTTPGPTAGGVPTSPTTGG